MKAAPREADGGQVNGYDTVHYSIDTARFDTIECGMLLKTGEFEKGDAHNVEIVDYHRG